MSKHFEISGYWKDDKSEFEAYLVREFDDSHEDEFIDNDIFFYGLGERDIIEGIELKEDTVHDFVITSYVEVEL